MMLQISFSISSELFLFSSNSYVFVLIKLCLIVSSQAFDIIFVSGRVPNMKIFCLSFLIIQCYQPTLIGPIRIFTVSFGINGRVFSFSFDISQYLYYVYSGTPFERPP